MARAWLAACSECEARKYPAGARADRDGHRRPGRPLERMGLLSVAVIGSHVISVAAQGGSARFGQTRPEEVNKTAKACASTPGAALPTRSLGSFSGALYAASNSTGPNGAPFRAGIALSD